MLYPTELRGPRRSSVRVLSAALSPDARGKLGFGLGTGGRFGDRTTADRGFSDRRRSGRGCCAPGFGAPSSHLSRCDGRSRSCQSFRCPLDPARRRARAEARWDRALRPPSDGSEARRGRIASPTWRAVEAVSNRAAVGGDSGVDVVGYSRLVEKDEAGTLTAIRKLRAEAIDPLLARHREGAASSS